MSRIDLKNNVGIESTDYELSYARSSGPGGQNVNKVNSKATLKWNISLSTEIPTDIITRFRNENANRINNEDQFVIQSDHYRDQIRNAEDCRKKLKELLEKVWLPPKKRRPTKPSKAKVEKRLQLKKNHSEKKKNRRWKAD